jgi:hypothetical protein
VTAPAERPHPNGADSVRRQLERDVLLMTNEERQEVRALIDAALARLPSEQQPPVVQP